MVSENARVQRTSQLTTRVLAPNPGPMTLSGTNSYAIGREGGSVIVVDPGPGDDAHLARLASIGHVELVLATHHHADHVEALNRFAREVGAPARAMDAAFCLGADPLADGEVIQAAGVRIRVMATPGHTADSVCFLLEEDGPAGSVLTGDTVLGEGSTIIAHPDGALAPYLSSLRALRQHGDALVLPGHGPALPSLGRACDAYLAHREERLAQVRAALATLGRDASVAEVADLVYADVPTGLRSAAEASLRAQLDFVREA